MAAAVNATVFGCLLGIVVGTPSNRPRAESVAVREEPHSPRDRFSTAPGPATCSIRKPAMFTKVILIFGSLVSSVAHRGQNLHPSAQSCDHWGDMETRRRISSLKAALLAGSAGLLSVSLFVSIQLAPRPRAPTNAARSWTPRTWSSCVRRIARSTTRFGTLRGLARIWRSPARSCSPTVTRCGCRLTLLGESLPPFLLE